MSIGTKIKALRFSRDMSEEDLAKEIGITGDKIKFWEKELNRPNNAALGKIADLFKIDIDYFFDDSVKPETNEKKQTELESLKTETKKAIIVEEQNPNASVSIIEKEKIEQPQISKKNDKIEKKDESAKSANADKIQVFKDKLQLKNAHHHKENSKPEPKSEKEKNSLTTQNIQLAILSELRKINAKIDELSFAVKNKPHFRNIKKLEATYSMDNANQLLKSGWVLLELFKDDKGILCYRLGSVEE